MREPRTDFRLVASTLVVVVLAGVGATYGAPLLAGHERVINILGTIFAVLAGFFIAVTSLIVDPSMVPRGSWKIAIFYREGQRGTMTRSKFAFYLYLIVLALLVAASMSPLREPNVNPSEVKVAWKALDWLTLFLSISAMGSAFSLPSMLHAIQTKRMDRLIDDRRKLDVEKQRQDLAREKAH